MISPAPLLLKSVMSLIGEKGLSVSDFGKLASLSRNFGYGYKDHMRACEFLVQEGVVDRHDNFLAFGVIAPTKWLINGLVSGDESFLTMMNEVPRRKWKFDPEKTVQQAIGLEGENFVVAELKRTLDTDLHHGIHHISLEDDGAGYDIAAPSHYESRDGVHLEVKTSTNLGPKFRFYLSRNESNVGRKDSNWYLVYVQKSQRGLELLGHQKFLDIQHLLPADASPDFLWGEVVGQVSVEDIRPGLP